MANIKSALELAMEKTEGLKGNLKTLKIKEIQNKGRKTASDFLFSIETKSDDLEAAVKAYPKDERENFKEGIKKALLTNIILPKSENFKETVNRIAEGLTVLSKDKKRITMFIEQLKQFLEQYLDNKKQLLEAAKNQYMPRLRQKEQEIAERTGQQVHLTPEQDPEFIEFLKQNIAKLDEQYSESLDQIKKELEGYIT